MIIPPWKIISKWFIVLETNLLWMCCMRKERIHLRRKWKREQTWLILQSFQRRLFTSPPEIAFVTYLNKNDYVIRFPLSLFFFTFNRFIRSLLNTSKWYTLKEKFRWVKVNSISSISIWDKKEFFFWLAKVV